MIKNFILGKFAAGADKPPAAGLQPFSAPPPGALAVLPARELLSRRRAAVNRIEELAGTTRPHFERYYLGALWRFAAWAQEFPLSAGRPQAGGLLDLGLASASAALRLRQGRLLPPGAPPEESALKKALWTYAVFTLALLRAAASPVLAQRVTVFGGGQAEWAWNPWDGAVGDNPEARWWRADGQYGRDCVVPPSAGLHLAPRLLDADGVAWLQSDPALFMPWLACAGGGDARAGVLAEIVNRAVADAFGRAATDAGPVRLAAAPASREGGGPSLRPVEKPPVHAQADDAESPTDAGRVADATMFPLDGFGPLEHGGGEPGRGEPVSPAAPAARPGHPAKAGAKKQQPAAATPGRECLAWIVEGVASGRLACNSRDARVHGVPEGVLLASPGIFQDYAKSVGRDDFVKIQDSLYRLKLHRRTSAGLNIHHYALAGQGTCINGVLLANPATVFGPGFPGPNPLLERL
jgi:hypothetical protein